MFGPINHPCFISLEEDKLFMSCFAMKTFALVNMNQELFFFFFFFHFIIQMKPFKQAKERLAKILMTDLCGMYLWDL